VLTIADGACSAPASEGVVVEGDNSVTLMNTSITSGAKEKWGVLMYQSTAGDAEGSEGVFIMTGGSLSYTDTTSPLFYITNASGYITLASVQITAASGVLLQAEGNDRWGTSGANGGAAIVTAESQVLEGDFVADELSSLDISLQTGSSLTGALNAEATAKTVDLTLDAASTWTVTADSYITTLTDPAITGTTITNITGNGHTVYYDQEACPELDGQTYTLNGGGTLTPAN
jgi:hypothetical protein